MRSRLSRFLTGLILMFFPQSGYRVHVYVQTQLLSLMHLQVNRWYWMSVRATTVFVFSYLTKVCFLCNLRTLLWVQRSLYLLYLSYANTTWVHYWTVSMAICMFNKNEKQDNMYLLHLIPGNRSSKLSHS